MSLENPSPANPEPSQAGQRGSLSVIAGSVWCVVCQGGDEVSEPVLLQDNLTEDQARKIADSSPKSMWAVIMAWPKASYDAWKNQRDALWERLSGNAPAKLVMLSTPTGNDGHLYRAWMSSQNVEVCNAPKGAEKSPK